MIYDIYLYTLCYYICCLHWRMYEMHPTLFFKTGCYSYLILVLVCSRQSLPMMRHVTS
jgi:hypothetical protein